MNILLLAAALALPAAAQTSDMSSKPDQSVQEQGGQLKSSPWANTGGGAASARGAPRQPREIEATAMVGAVVIGAGLFVLAERRRIGHFENPGGTEAPHERDEQRNVR